MGLLNRSQPWGFPKAPCRPADAQVVAFGRVEKVARRAEAVMVNFLSCGDGHNSRQRINNSGARI